MVRYLLFILLLIIGYSSSSFAQLLGGKSSFAFASLPASARLTALGGTAIAVVDKDVNLGTSNPASLVEVLSGSIALNYNFHFADISFGHAAYGHKLNKWGGIGLQIAASYANYGDFIAADDTGTQQGSFSASESMLTIGAAKKLNDRIQVGANLKFANAALETYSAFGLLGDLGLQYITTEGRTVVAATINNFGVELKTIDGKKYGTPINMQIGISNRLKHLPLRVSVIGHHLQRWNIRYDDPNSPVDEDFFGTEEQPSALKENIDNLFRHLIFNGEFLIGKSQNFNLRFSYNHLRRRELSVSQFRSFAGYGLGFGIKISKFKLDYGVGYHHLAGGTNHLSISTNLSEFRSKL